MSRQLKHQDIRQARIPVTLAEPGRHGEHIKAQESNQVTEPEHDFQNLPDSKVLICPDDNKISISTNSMVNYGLTGNETKQKSKQLIIGVLT